MELIKENWDWIASNPWGFAAIALACFGAGWGLARLFYGERIELLKEKASSSAASTSLGAPPAAFHYRPSGRHGRNVLATETHDVKVGESLSFQADVPSGQKLRITLSGPPCRHLSETTGAWYFNLVGLVNWTNSQYQESTSGSSQHFNAEDGRADMQLVFVRPGTVSIVAFEGDSRTQSWSKTVQVSG